MSHLALFENERNTYLKKNSSPFISQDANLYNMLVSHRKEQTVLGFLLKKGGINIA